MCHSFSGPYLYAPQLRSRPSLYSPGDCDLDSHEGHGGDLPSNVPSIVPLNAPSNIPSNLPSIIPGDCDLDSHEGPGGDRSDCGSDPEAVECDSLLLLCAKQCWR